MESHLDSMIHFGSNKIFPFRAYISSIYLYIIYVDPNLDPSSWKRKEWCDMDIPTHSSTTNHAAEQIQEQDILVRSMAKKQSNARKL